MSKLFALIAVAVALGWGVVFAVAAPALAVGWAILWAVVIALDFALYRDTAPPPPTVRGEVVPPAIARDSATGRAEG